MQPLMVYMQPDKTDWMYIVKHLKANLKANQAEPEDWQKKKTKKCKKKKKNSFNRTTLLNI